MTAPLPARLRKSLAALEKHYHEPVRPVSEYCHALDEWARVMRESGYDTESADAWGRIRGLPLMKSNLAARLVYGKEAVRSRPCPIHKGRWSGCVWGEQMCAEGCMFGSNVTGWLPDDHPFDPFTEGEFHGFDFSARCRQCGGAETATVHISSATGDCLQSSPK